MLILERAGQLEKQNRTFALATIIESKGSTPRHSGKMIVLEDGSIEGTVGGGASELYVIEESLKAMKENSSRLFECELNQDRDHRISMHCGGTLKVFIEVFNQRPELFIIGAGHVGLAVAKMAEMLGYPYSVIDDRPNYCTKERYPKAKNLYVDEDIIAAVDMAPFSKGTYAMIFTKDSDDMALKAVLNKSYAYVGMIGSKRKIKRIFEKLLAEGVAQEKLEGIRTPIGLEIHAETPEEIAVSIMAEVIKESREQKTNE